jgi:predicted  nucleic acid-binding Zn-ribbon protein
MTHAAHKNWREVIVKPKDGLNDQLTEANKQKEEAKAEQKRLQQALVEEADRYVKRLAALEHEKSDLAKEKDKQAAEILAKDGELRLLRATVASVHSTLENLRVEADSIRKEIKIALDQRQELARKLERTNDDLVAAVNERQRLEKLGRELAAIITKLTTAMQYQKAVADGYMEKAPPEGSIGIVTAITGANTVEISLGYDDGIRKGHRFSVIRSTTGKYVCDVEVLKVDNPNRAVCRADKATQNDQIQKGDYVKASLSKTR